MGAVLALRLLPPLLVAAAACAAALRLGWPAASTLGTLGPFLVCAVAPVAPQVRSRCRCMVVPLALPHPARFQAAPQLSPGPPSLGAWASLLESACPCIVLHAALRTRR